MYMVANRRVSSLESFVSAGTHGSLVFSRQKAPERTRMRARSRALAALRWTGGLVLEPAVLSGKSRW